MPKLILNETEVKSLIMDSLVGKLEDRIANGWNNKINEVVDGVILENAGLIESKLEKMLSTALNSASFGKALQEEFNHKIAKNLVAKLEGSVEKAVEAYRSNPLLRAKLITTIEKVIERESKNASSTN